MIKIWVVLQMKDKNNEYWCLIIPRKISTITHTMIKISKNQKKKNNMMFFLENGIYIFNIFYLGY